MLYRCASTGLVLLHEPTFFTCTLCGPRVAGFGRRSGPRHPLADRAAGAVSGSDGFGIDCKCQCEEGALTVTLHRREKWGGNEIMAKNLLRESWSDLDQADLRLLLQERIGQPGQYDGDEDVIHLPLAREQCRVSLTYEGAKIIAIKSGPAFDSEEWDRICAEIEGPIMKGPPKVGRDISFNTKGVGGWWRGERSGVQILPAPENAPRAKPRRRQSLYPRISHPRCGCVAHDQLFHHT